MLNAADLRVARGDEQVRFRGDEEVLAFSFGQADSCRRRTHAGKYLERSVAADVHWHEGASGDVPLDVIVFQQRRLPRVVVDDVAKRCWGPQPEHPGISSHYAGDFDLQIRSRLMQFPIVDVDLGGAQVVVAEELRGDVHRKAGGDGFGGEDPPEVMWGIAQRVTVGADELGALDGELEQAMGGTRADHPQLGSVSALEQVGQRGAGQPLVGVVAGDERHVLVARAGALHDARQYVCQLRGDQQDPLLVELGRRDLQQGHHLTGIGQLVRGQREVGKFQHLLVPDSGVPQGLDDRPGPERLILGAFDVHMSGGVAVFDPNTAGATLVTGTGVGGDLDPSVADTVECELLPNSHAGRRGQQLRHPRRVLLDTGDEIGQQRRQGSGALVHPGTPLTLVFHAATDVLVADRAAEHPGRPGGVLGRPVRYVEVERADGEEHAVAVRPRQSLAVGAALETGAFLPRGSDVGRQVDGLQAGVVFLDVFPERSNQQTDEATQRDVVPVQTPDPATPPHTRDSGRPWKSSNASCMSAATSTSFGS